jgi:Uncharacterized protein family UPF0029
MEDVEESLQLALADVEILRSAYPDETAVENDVTDPTLQYPLHVTLHLSETAFIQFEFVQGYPGKSNVQVATYRSKATEHARLERAVAAVRVTALQCLEDGVEGGLACCASALDAWNEGDEDAPDEERLEVSSPETGQAGPPLPLSKTFEWISGEPLHDRKSAFQAHVCRVNSEADIKPALQQLLNNSKLQRATHNMVSSHRAAFALVSTS